MSNEERKDIEKVTDETQTARFRIGGRIVLVLVFLSLTVFMGYLIKVQYGIQHTRYDEYSYKASQMHWQRIKDVPNRGDILDRNGNILASTTYEHSRYHAFGRAEVPGDEKKCPDCGRDRRFFYTDHRCG